MWTQLPYLLDQSLAGTHHLFPDDAIAVALGQPADESVAPPVAEATEVLLDDLRAAPDIPTQRACVARAEPEVRGLFIRLYFRYLTSYARLKGMIAGH